MGQLKFISFMIPSAITLFISATFFHEKPVLSAKNIEKNIARVNDSLYAWRYETSNKEYNTFLADLAKKDSVLYTNCLTDSLGWRQIMTYCEPMVEYYHRHPGFADYPVVNVSYEGANEYCKWLTEVYNDDPKRKFKKVVFVLPQIKEWEFAARSGVENRRYPWGKNYTLRDKNGMFLCNCRRINETLITADSIGKPVMNGEGSVNYSAGLNDRAFYTAEVKSFLPNDFGIYNMSGNVAEMTIEKTYSMGGSWNSFGGEVTTTSTKQYKETSPEVGFRVFMKIIEY